MSHSYNGEVILRCGHTETQHINDAIVELHAVAVENTQLRAKLLELVEWFDRVKDHGATSWTREDSQRLEAMRALAVLG